MPTALPTTSQPASSTGQSPRAPRCSKCASRSSQPRNRGARRRSARAERRVPMHTSWPRAASAAATCRPMNPVPPSTSTLIACLRSVISVLTEMYGRISLQSMAAVHKLSDPLSEALGAPGRRFVLHWGEMGWRWGVNRTVSQLHALLFLMGRPMHAEEIAELLQVARSNVSNSLRELENWNLVRVVHLVGDRRDHYETAQDPWELLRIIVRERKAREFDPTLAVLREGVTDTQFSRLDPAAQTRVREMLALMESLSGWTAEMLGLDTRTLARLLKGGSRIQTLPRPAV